MAVHPGKTMDFAGPKAAMPAWGVGATAVAGTRSVSAKIPPRFANVGRHTMSALRRLIAAWRCPCQHVCQVGTQHERLSIRPRKPVKLACPYVLSYSTMT